MSSNQTIDAILEHGYGELTLSKAEGRIRVLQSRITVKPNDNESPHAFLLRCASLMSDGDESSVIVRHGRIDVVHIIRR